MELTKVLQQIEDSLLDTAEFSFRHEVYNVRSKQFEPGNVWVFRNPSVSEMPLGDSVGSRGLYIEGDLWLLSKDATFDHSDFYDLLVAKGKVTRGTPYATVWFFPPKRLEVDASPEDLDMTNLKEFDIVYL